ncbi:WhiB family transcriptional regulator [Jonesiaceae bacterium BS-20]|uniref:Transcriptional regulator WhiB n=1 Tax=Jonesiaceae bacterium BS-20 TaxID=3120821 RepID=A0AAU7DXH2_9MICO
MWNLLKEDGPLPTDVNRPAEPARVGSPVLSLLGNMGDDSAMSWQERALCAQTDPEAFFPEKGGSTREAKKVCVACEVRTQCLEYALAKDERFGIWGGLSERERRKLKKRAL